MYCSHRNWTSMLCSRLTVLRQPGGPSHGGPAPTVRWVARAALAAAADEVAPHVHDRAVANAPAQSSRGTLPSRPTRPSTAGPSSSHSRLADPRSSCTSEDARRSVCAALQLCDVRGRSRLSVLLPKDLHMPLVRPCRQNVAEAARHRRVRVPRRMPCPS